ncbi:MAG TPA: GNAT family N-acetyltransferase [Agitococcus sp.]|jgi:GNAT superfamily N-acetyltransferase|uniref:GNAT family N-acetyltransferase n=1 Tax=uncultured Agitococcus sp. TaxID=1506599 RepID=UPI00261A13ED|nr:GNAT family N-acetyltransferase [uncultured Agitococcus sp.]HMU88366.1 GNAT family N-acetyltransferase [Agitococcus sp.]HMV61229.1 GNAT family N-acetyltransferase [Agitococcus sp.]HMY00731.1 GNAT family N-acetyltransferase [Agitococcus sp.]HNA21456.1 GNAT family N-acetyltransferase [Agitococcus sp.]HNC03739.1 GNAT family N-acetyltransferase [Agitococcus sp.]
MFDIDVLSRQYQRDRFDCGQVDLNTFIKQYALQQQGRFLSQTYVAYNPTKQVIGFYSLANGSTLRDDLPITEQKRLPRYPIPCVIIGRFAVDINYQGKGLGQALLRHAFKKIIDISTLTGTAYILVHAKDDKAASFYQKLGFQSFPQQALTLFLPVASLPR